MSFYTKYNLAMTKGDGNIGTAQLGQSISIDRENISYSQNNKQLTLKWYDTGSALSNATRFAIPIQGYSMGTNEHDISAKLYVDGKLQDSATLTGVTYNASDTSWIYWEPYINWSRTINVNELISHDRTLDIEIEVTGGNEKEYTYKGSIEFAQIFLDLNKIDFDVSSSVLTLATTVSQKVSISFRPELILKGRLRYKTSGVEIAGTELELASSSSSSSKMEKQFNHHSSDEIYMRAETDTVQLIVEYITSSLDVCMVSGNTAYIDAYTIKVDPTYVSKNMTIGTKGMQYVNEAHTYPAEWGYLQNQSYVIVPITVDVPVSRARNATLEVLCSCPAANINRVSMGTQQITASQIEAGTLITDGQYYRVTVTVILPLYYAGENTFTYNFTDGGSNARPSGVVTAEDSPLTVVEYFSPTITGFNAYRATREGSSGAITEKVDSTNIAFTAAWKIASVNNQNTTTVRKIECSTDGALKHTIEAASINNGVESYYTSFAFDIEKSYQMVFTITDRLNYTASYTFVLPPARVFLDFKAGGKGMGIGKVAETDQLEVQFDTDFYGDVNFRGKVTGLSISGETEPEFTNLKVTNSATMNEATFNGDVQFNGNVYGLPGGAKIGSDYSSGVGCSYIQTKADNYTKVDIDYEIEQTLTAGNNTTTYDLSDYVATWGVPGTRHYESTVVSGYYQLSGSTSWYPIDNNHVYGNVVEVTFGPVKDPKSSITITKYNDYKEWKVKIYAHRSILFATS